MQITEGQRAILIVSGATPVNNRTSLIQHRRVDTIRSFAMADERLRILIFGAHPDDVDFTAGGTAALYARQGHEVLCVSVTNGDAGHQTEAGAYLARRRRAEAEAAGKVIGVRYITLDNHDGELLPTLENRRQIIRLIRQFKPDLMMSPRPNDYPSRSSLHRTVDPGRRLHGDCPERLRRYAAP